MRFGQMAMHSAIRHARVNNNSNKRSRPKMATSHVTKKLRGSSYYGDDGISSLAMPATKDQLCVPHVSKETSKPSTLALRHLHDAPALFITTNASSYHPSNSSHAQTTRRRHDDNDEAFFL